MENAQYRDEEFSRKARDRLSGALSLASDQVDHGGSDLMMGIPDISSGLDSPLKRIFNSTSPWNSPVKSPRPSRRRKRKETPRENVFHHTFVLKLFDRSVDLAQFKENTALYPICRAWIKDQPHNKKFAPRVRSPTPEPKEDTGSKDGSSEETEKNGEPLSIASSENDESEDFTKKKNVYKLPAFKPLPSQDISLRIPKIAKTPEVQDFHIEKIQSDQLTTTKLISQHMSHWQNVRKSWRNAYMKNEQRYEEGMKILQEMFEK